MNLLPFNLEDAIANPERVVYRNGEKPLDWHKFNVDCEFPIKSLIRNRYHKHRMDGKFNTYNTIDPYDLMLLPLPENTYWANVYRMSNRDIFIGEAYDSLDAAIANIAPEIKTYVKTISFTI